MKRDKGQTRDELIREIETLRQRNEELEAQKAESLRMGRALRDSEERYRSLVKQSSDGVYIFDPLTTRILEVNDQFLRIFGYEEHETAALTLFDLVVLDRETILENVERVQENGQFVFGLREYRRKNGSVVDVEISSTEIHYGDGRVIMVNVRDVTERREAERELNAQAETLRAQAELLDIAEDAIVMLDLEDRIVFWNRGAEERYGWNKKEAIGKNVHKLLKTKFPRRLSTIKKELFKTGKLECELVHRKRDGTSIFVSSRWAARKDQDGNPIAIVEVNNDITGYKKGEENLRKSKSDLEQRVIERTMELQQANERLTHELRRREQIENMLRRGAERYKNLFENSIMGIYRADPEGRILMANPTLVKMMGYRSFDELSTASSKKARYEPTFLKKKIKNRLARQGRVRGFDAVWERPDKTRMYVRENARAIRDVNGSVLYYEGTVEDMSEQKKAEERIELYQKQLRSLAAELSLAEERERRRVATILHDSIGQFLAISKIRLGVLLGAAGNGEISESIREVREYVDQAIRYTRSLTLELSPPILYELGLESAIEWLAERVQEEHHFRVEVEKDAEQNPVSDEIKVFIFTAVRELLHNIAKHARATMGKVTIRRVSDTMSIHVADDGTGFNPVRTVGYEDGSKGFGLFSIRERLHHLGGQMDVKSQKGRGTRVALVTPLRIEADRKRRERT